MSRPPTLGTSPSMRRRPQGRYRIDGRRRLTSPVLRGERGAAVKPLRRECRSCRLTCTDLWALSFQPTRPAGAVSARHSLRPLLLEGHRIAKPGANSRRGKERSCLFVIASKAKQSIDPLVALWIASSLALLAMTICTCVGGTPDHGTGFPVYGIDAVRPPSTGNAWPLT